MWFYKLIATGFGAGYSKFAPGTMGALVALLMWLLSVYCFSYTTHTILLVVCIIVFTILGIYCTDKVIPLWGKDPSRVVVDEMVGVWIPLLIASKEHVLSYILAFAFFRLFDIFKPLGIRKMESLKGGLGVMMDDVLAGIYSVIVLFVISYFIGWYNF